MVCTRMGFHGVEVIVGALQVTIAEGRKQEETQKPASTMRERTMEVL